jgi:hypothetical protein
LKHDIFYSDTRQTTSIQLKMNDRNVETGPAVGHLRERVQGELESKEE